MEPDNTSIRPVLTAADLEQEMKTIETKVKTLEVHIAKVKAEEMVLIKELLKAQGALAAIEALRKTVK